MLLVRTYLDKSDIHGIGLFATEPIKKGTVIWEYRKGFDFMVKDSDLYHLPRSLHPFRAFVLWYGYLDSKTMKHVVCADDARFMNHSFTPNTDNTNNDGTIANRDITVQLVKS